MPGSARRRSASRRRRRRDGRAPSGAACDRNLMSALIWFSVIGCADVAPNTKQKPVNATAASTTTVEIMLIGGRGAIRKAARHRRPFASNCQRRLTAKFADELCRRAPSGTFRMRAVSKACCFLRHDRMDVVICYRVCCVLNSFRTYGKGSACQHAHGSFIRAQRPTKICMLETRCIIAQSI